jgi:ABC-type transport system involved in multi-copper enzyme maturation permease subunit
MTGRETWQLRRTQVGTIVRLELGKTLLSLRGLWLYLLAFAPAVIVGLHALVAAAAPGRHVHTLEDDTEVLAGLFQLYYLRVGIFFGCLGIFTRLFRGEMMEKSAHYYLLTPVRRELLAVGKFLAGAIAAASSLGLGVLAAFLLMYCHFGPEARAFMLGGPGLGHLGAYLLVTVLACLGYGALFLLIGLLAKNPILPAIGVLLWESVNHLLPASLKLLSVIFYLEPLLPVSIPAKGLTALFAIPAEPIATAIAVPGLLVVTTVILAFACWRVRETEINYSAD